MWWLVIPVAIYSTGIFALWLILQRKRDTDQPTAPGKVRVSVVVAARNEEKTIVTLLNSLAEQDYPKDLLEVIIVNDNSTDRTPIVVSEYFAQHNPQPGINIRLIYNPFQGKKSAIRYGVEKSAGELILMTDADCCVGPGWVSAFSAFFAAGNADMIAGEVYQKPGRGFASYFGSFEFSALQSITEAAVRAGHPVMCNAANMAVRKDIYLKHAGEVRSEIPSGDDVFLLHAVKRSGGIIGYMGESAAAAVTAGAVTVAALLRQRARWASKTFYYRDAATLTLTAATAACNAAVAAAAAASFISIKYLPLTCLLYAIRLVPDLLITYRNFKKRKEHPPLLLFLLSELIYPFYFLTVAVLSLFPRSRHFRKRD